MTSLDGQTSWSISDVFFAAKCACCYWSQTHEEEVIRRAFWIVVTRDFFQEVTDPQSLMARVIYSPFSTLFPSDENASVASDALCVDHAVPMGASSSATNAASGVGADASFSARRIPSSASSSTLGAKEFHTDSYASRVENVL